MPDGHGDPAGQSCPGSCFSRNAVLAGAQTASLLNLTIGQTVDINGRRMHVSGILGSTGSQDNRLLSAELSTAQVILVVLTTVMSSISALQLGKSYGRGSAVVHALAGVSFTIDSGVFVGIMGESGAGKSTLLSILGAMNTPTTGTLTVDGIDVYDLKSEKRADFRREFLGFVFQSFHLIPYLNLLENVMLPLTTIRMPKSEKRRKAQAALDRVGLGGKGE